MNAKTKVVIGIGVVLLLAAAVALSLRQQLDRGVEVRMEEVAERDLVSIVTASGNIRPRGTVDISSDISARVTELMVEEGEDVEAGQVLLQLDRTQYEAVVSRSRGALRQQRANERNAQANYDQARRTLDRLLEMYRRDTLFVTQQQLDDAQTSVELANAQLESAESGVEQAQASLDEALEQLAKTTIVAPRAGKVTRLNVEEGETVVVGTMNNPGSLVLTISDLSTVEVVVQVDETDVTKLEIGDSASVDIDAFPEVEFTGRITEIGNSAIQAPTGSSSGSQSAIDFEVVITLADTPVLLRPDLSATADIVTESRKNAVSIPIIALTIRDPAVEATEPGETPPPPPEGESREVEGVFVVEDGTVRFTPVEVGITGEEHFEVLGGVEVGDTVVAGPYQAVRSLTTGDPVRRMEDEPVSRRPAAGG